MSIINRPELINKLERYKMCTFAFALLFWMKWIDADLEDLNTRLILAFICIGSIFGGIYYYSWKDKTFIKQLHKIMLLVVAFYITMAFVPLMVFNDK